MKRVLNVGGNRKDIPLPALYQSWQHVLLDIDPRGNPDVVCDGRELATLAPAVYDAVYCSHNLEHYYRHDVPKVLAGFLHVLKPDGFAEVRVPDLGELMRIVVDRGMDIDDVLYQSGMGPVTPRDVLFGLGAEVERSGCEFFAHKTGFTQKSLGAMLQRCGFPTIFMRAANLEVEAYAFKTRPPAEIAAALNLPPLPGAAG